MTTITDDKRAALAEYLEEDADDWSESSYDDSLFECGNRKYLVLTDEEADDRNKEYLKETVWAFRSSFLASHMPDGVSEEVIKAVQEKCESGNEALRAMILDWDHFVDDATGTDNRGHFLSSYDGEEIEHEGFYIYRVN